MPATDAIARGFPDLAHPAGAQSRLCRAHAEQFPWDATAASMLELFANVGAGRCSTRRPVA